MQTSLKITFRHLEPSPALEADIRQWMSELESVFEGIVSCHVVIEQPHQHHQQGRRFRVRLDLAVPGGVIAVGRNSDESDAHEDPYLAVRDAFRAAQRRLEAHVDRIRGEVKSHRSVA
jgi:ribosome-associated translation inhibitor RaiA